MLGGRLPADLGVPWVPITSRSSYSVSVTDFLIEGRSVAGGGYLYAGTIVDSGTSLMALPKSMLDIVLEKIGTAKG